MNCIGVAATSKLTLRRGGVISYENLDAEGYKVMCAMWPAESEYGTRCVPCTGVHAHLECWANAATIMRSLLLFRDLEV